MPETYVQEHNRQNRDGTISKVRDYFRGSNREAAREWVKGKTVRGNNMFSEGNRIYSYGHHFPIAEIDRDKKIAYVNSDKYSRTTSKHQGMVGAALAYEGYNKIPRKTEEF